MYTHLSRRVGWNYEQLSCDPCRCAKLRVNSSQERVEFRLVGREIPGKISLGRGNIACGPADGMEPKGEGAHIRNMPVSWVCVEWLL